MSNPAVTKLVRGKIGKLSFWMDDNIGESIHIHLADFRLDLTTEELHVLSEDLKDVINKTVNIDGFDCHKIDPVYLSRFLAPLLKNLVRVEIDTVDLKDLKVCYDVRGGFTKYTDIAHSRAVKALQGDSKENDDYRGSHHIGQTSQERLDTMFNSIKENDYPYDGQYIILYNDQMLIRDGQHRASCLYCQRGNIKIPVMRLYFDDRSLITYEESYVKQAFLRLKKIRLGHIWHRFLSGTKRRLKVFASKLYFKRNSKQIFTMEKVYFDNFQ